MVGDRLPAPGQRLVDVVRKGVAMFGQDKRQVFAPNAVSEMNCSPGRHQCRPTGRIVEPAEVEASLLHYKYVDPLAYLLRRQRSLAARMLEGDR